MRACSYCQREFTPTHSSMQAVCSVACAAKKVRRDKAEKKREAALERKKDKAKLLDIKPLSHFEKLAEQAVNRYVRLRDHSLGCCSCDKPASWAGQWHASHLRSVGAAPAVRYNLWNIAKACSQCNLHLSGNLSVYLPRAIEKHGQDKIDWLYAQNKPAKRSREYLERLAKVFNRKARRAKLRLGMI